MPERAALALLGAAVLGLAALLVVGLSDERRTAFTLGVAPTGVAAELGPGMRTCQRPVRVAQTFTQVAFRVGTFKGRGQPLAVTVTGSGRVARGRLGAGYADGAEQAVSVGSVREGGSVAVCISNMGRRRVAIYGGAGAAARLTSASVDGKDAGVDLALVFKRDARSGIASLPDAFEHASRFRPGWVAPWLFWLLAAVVLVGAPVALGQALRTAVATDEAGREAKLGG